MKHGRIAVTPGFLSIAFGLFLIALAGIAGFYMPKETSGRSVVRVASPDANSPRNIGASAIVTPRANPTSSPTPASAATVAPSSQTKPSSVTATPQTIPSPTVAPTIAATTTVTVSVPTKATATPAPTFYTVKTGDTLSEIADMFGLSTNGLLRANGMTDPDKLAVGDKLVIPGR